MIKGQLNVLAQGNHCQTQNKMHKKGFADRQILNFLDTNNNQGRVLLQEKLQAFHFDLAKVSNCAVVKPIPIHLKADYSVGADVYLNQNET